MKIVPVFFTVLLFFIIADKVTASSKIDTVYFQNGDRITGEVKSLDKNVLRLSTDDAGTLNLEWTRVDSLYINNPMRIIMDNGTIYYGRLFPAAVRKECIIHELVGTIRQKKLEHIVELLPANDRFVDRLNGTVSAGLSYTKASEVMQMDFSGTIQYWTRKNMWEGNYNLVLTNEKDAGTTQRQNGGGSFQRVLPKKWFIQANLLAESNSEFELDLRTSVGFGGGNNLFHDYSKRLYWGAGLLFNKEIATDLDQNNLEGIVVASYSMYILDAPEVMLNVKGNLIPSLNRWGRIRSEVDMNLKWELFDDFYLKGTFYNSFDNQPLSGTDVKSDWGYTFGLEYKI